MVVDGHFMHILSPLFQVIKGVDESRLGRRGSVAFTLVFSLKWITFLLLNCEMFLVRSKGFISLVYLLVTQFINVKLRISRPWHRCWKWLEKFYFFHLVPRAACLAFLVDHGNHIFYTFYLDWDLISLGNDSRWLTIQYIFCILNTRIFHWRLILNEDWQTLFVLTELVQNLLSLGKWMVL